MTYHRQFTKQMRGWDLTTAEIMYHLPDHYGILQSYIWQEYDMPPRFPRLMQFLDFWTHNLDGPLAEVRVAHRSLVGPARLELVDAEWRLQ